MNGLCQRLLSVVGPVLLLTAIVSHPQIAEGIDLPRENPRRVDLHGDSLPEGAIARLGTVRFWLGNAFAAFSPDGKMIAAASGQYQDQIIRLLRRAQRARMPLVTRAVLLCSETRMSCSPVARKHQSVKSGLQASITPMLLAANR